MNSGAAVGMRRSYALSPDNGDVDAIQGRQCVKGQTWAEQDADRHTVNRNPTLNEVATTGYGGQCMT
jgi:hypothetical protein